jgi:hypothetical protein
MTPPTGSIAPGPEVEAALTPNPVGAVRLAEPSCWGLAWFVIVSVNVVDEPPCAAAGPIAAENGFVLGPAAPTGPTASASRARAPIASLG